MTSSKRIALLLLALTPFSCREKDDKQPASDNQNWSLATPESKGMDPGFLDKSKQYAFQEGKNTQGVLIIKDGVKRIPKDLLSSEPLAVLPFFFITQYPPNILYRSKIIAHLALYNSHHLTGGKLIKIF